MKNHGNILFSVTSKNPCNLAKKAMGEHSLSRPASALQTKMLFFV